MKPEYRFDHNFCSKCGKKLEPLKDHGNYNIETGEKNYFWACPDYKKLTREEMKEIYGDTVVIGNDNGHGWDIKPKSGKIFLES